MNEVIDQENLYEINIKNPNHVIEFIILPNKMSMNDGSFVITKLNECEIGKNAKQYTIVKQ